MNPNPTWPGLELAALVPLFGAGLVALSSGEFWSRRLAVLASFASAALALAAVADGGAGAWLALDPLGRSLFVLVALVHLLVLSATSRVRADRRHFAGLLLGQSLRLGAVAAPGPFALVAFLALEAVLVWLECAWRGGRGRVVAYHLGASVACLVLGTAGVRAQSDLAPWLILAGVVGRAGLMPMHLWTADLFQQARISPAVLALTPGVAALAAFRLLVPAGSEAALGALAALAIVTAVVSAMLAVVQADARRALGLLIQSHTALIFVGAGVQTPLGAAGALCVWLSLVVSLTGLGVVATALEARFGRLTLSGYAGRYDRSPGLAVAFLVMGLGSVGFPGTFGFPAAELLLNGALDANLALGAGLVVAAAFNGLAVLRAYSHLFLGPRGAEVVPLGLTPRERLSLLSLAAIVVVVGLVPAPVVRERHAAASGQWTVAGGQ